MNFWNSTTEAIVTIACAVVGLAILSVMVSKKSDTAKVIQAAASGFSNSIATAIAPITGARADPVLAYPGSQSGIDGMTGMGVNGYGF
jgi:hypothetical protein